ncbi:MAG: hypothetical protein ACYCOU_20415 [Sulfobacillus sp.]
MSEKRIMAKAAGLKGVSGVPNPEQPKPRLRLEGKQAEKLQKSTKIGKPIKMIVHARVLDHGLDPFNGYNPTSSLEIHKIQPVKAPKAAKAPKSSYSAPKGKMK